MRAEEQPQPSSDAAPAKAAPSTPAPPADPKAAAPPRPPAPRLPLFERAWHYIADYFVGESPTFWVAMVPMLVLAAVLYTRHFSSNYIFDEQEALLANPYVNGKSLGFLEAIHRDFWGLPPERSVGSYRPLPNYVWRAVWETQRFLTIQIGRLTHNAATPAMQPFLFHWLNVLMHAANGAMITMLVYFLSKRRGLAWVAGGTFVGAAVITEAVCGVVGIADVMGGMGAALALLALRLPMWGMPMAVFGAVLMGLFSKESALVCVPLIPFAALVLAPLTHPAHPRRWARASLALLSSASAFVLYVQLRKKWFPAPLPAEYQGPVAADATMPKRIMHGFLTWFHQAPLPRDPLNNPLAEITDTKLRIAGALRVFWRGLSQVVFPWRLSGDYSFPQEPAPTSLWEPENVLGAIAMVGLPIASIALLIWAWRRERARAVAPSDDSQAPVDPTTVLPVRAMLTSLGLMWIVVSYFPHSNIPILLPTVRAERFWYFPVMGSSLVIACFVSWLYERTKHKMHGSIAIGVFAAFFVFQGARARMHALDYKDDLVFWDATRRAVPHSAKAHLNYSVMWGARGRLDIRLDSNAVAAQLAPKWPMSHVYLGDTLCRMHRADEAWGHYATGFELAPGDPNLIALALQCLWDENSFEQHRDELNDMAVRHPGSWLAYLAVDTLRYGKEHNPQGVDPKYRPRGYNEGPKE